VTHTFPTQAIGRKKSNLSIFYTHKSVTHHADRMGIGEYPNSGDKGAWTTEAMTLSKTYSRLKAMVFWHERWENEDGTYSNLRVHSSPTALEAYRKSVADSYWLGTPQFQNLPGH
jgi:hypothetical protein